MRKPLFLPSSNPILRLLFFVALSLSLIYLDQRTHYLDTTRTFLSTILYPLQAIVDFPSRSASWVNEALVNRSKLVRKNAELRAENLKLSSRLRSLDSLRYENQELQSLLNAAKKLKFDYIVGRMLAVSMNAVQQKVIIDKGSKDGIQEGTPMLDGQGLMGEIIHVYPYHAEAVLISDTSEAIPIRVVRNGIRGILTGMSITTSMEVLYLPADADIRQGDMLVTSGLGGRFPPDLPVATISHLTTNPGSPFARVKATPLASLTQSRRVLVISPTTTDQPSTSTGNTQ